MENLGGIGHFHPIDGARAESKQSGKQQNHTEKDSDREYTADSNPQKPTRHPAGAFSLVG